MDKQKLKKSYTRAEVQKMLINLLPSLIRQADAVESIAQDMVTSSVQGLVSQTTWLKGQTRAERRQAELFRAYHAGRADVAHDMVLRMEHGYEELMDREDLWPKKDEEARPL